MADYTPTTDQMQSWASDMTSRQEYAEFIRGLKAEYFRQWTNNPSAADRERIYAKIHVVSDIESTLKALSDGKVIDIRKAQQKVKK